MTERLIELQHALAGVRERLGALAERLARVKQRYGQPAPAGSGLTAAAVVRSSPPFGGADARPIDDVELTFRAVDIDADAAAGADASSGSYSDQGKAR